MMGQELAAAEAVARATDASEEQLQAARAEIHMAFEILPELPHSLQARMIVIDGGRVWCSLDEAAIVGSASDITLKHGPSVSGEWHMLAVLDAYPYNPAAKTEDGQPIIDLIAEIAGVGPVQRVLRLAESARTVLGRPPEYFGVTPVLIFRSAGG